MGMKKGTKLLYINFDFDGPVMTHLRKCKICQSKQPCDFKTLINFDFRHLTCECEICIDQRSKLK